jgi:hypothetical protein
MECDGRHLNLLRDLPASDVTTPTNPRNTLHPAEAFFDLLTRSPGNLMLLCLLSFLHAATRQRASALGRLFLEAVFSFDSTRVIAPCGTMSRDSNAM